MTDNTPIRRALISVADKTHLIELASALVKQDIEILSTGGTYAQLLAANIPATEVADVTGFPEILSGRVKTLHPHIHAGILARRGIDEAVLNQHQIQTIDLVIVNLYPFIKTVTQPDCDIVSAIENIDIGGPTMIRAAAKNQQDVVVITDPKDYTQLIELINANNNAISLEWKRHFAAKAFAHTAAYDAAIANYFEPYQNEQKTERFGDFFIPSLKLGNTLRYGENPHQQAAVYQDALSTKPTLANTQPLQGKALSYNNLADADAAYAAVQSMPQPSCVIVKHASPCGMAQAESACDAYKLAFRCDPSAAFGGIIAFNTGIDDQVCQAIIDNQFLEVLIAPSITQEGLAVLAQKPNIRVLCLPNSTPSETAWVAKRIHGGLLVQSADLALTARQDMQVVSEQHPTETQWQDLCFAWNAVKYIKSNAIVLAKNLATIGIGAGQMSRVFSVHTARQKAEDADISLADCVLASDAFFPFKDNIELAANFGVSAIIQPGGSIKDDEVIDCANQHGIVMVLTGKRHFLH